MGVNNMSAAGLRRMAEEVRAESLTASCPVCCDWEHDQSDDCLIAQYGNGCDNCDGTGTVSAQVWPEYGRIVYDANHPLMGGIVIGRDKNEAWVRWVDTGLASTHSVQELLREPVPCLNRGPRIGDTRPACKLPKGHVHKDHRPGADDGWEEGLTW